MEQRVKFKYTIWIIIASILILIFILLPLSINLLAKENKVALIPIIGTITVDGSSFLGQTTVSSSDIVNFIKEAEENPQVQAIILEVNSPGGSAVASDEIATAVKKAEKPVVAVIREAGASGGYWIVSATDQIIANKMSITGSIGVVSSYLEFSGLMEKYGVGYEQLMAGKYKDLGTPLRKLSAEEEMIIQKKLDTIHTFFIKEIAANRNLPEERVRELATGEYYLGVEALNLGLVDQLGDQSTAEEYLKQTLGLEDVDYITYQKNPGFLEMLSGVFHDFSFHLGQGIGSLFLIQDSKLMI